ncbi:MAG: TPM domain-containing protein [Deltaproteobacteria bacterium]|nr:MAG: TPM domain-containing protein [Deltaproteobacteria bacterium]
MRSLAALLATVIATARAVEPPVPAPQGYVTDLAHVIGPEVRARIERLNEELRDKTGAEIAVVTVDTTAPLDDFTYAMRIADAWKPGRKREDTGVVFLVATRDRKLRILVGYGLEGILPDGLVGEIEDREVVPAFRAGRIDEGVGRGVAALAARIADARGVVLTGTSRPRAPAPVPLPGWVLLLIILVFAALVLYQASTRPARFRRGGFYPVGPFGGFGGGFGGGGGGFGGFGGGSFGGGGAGRSW